MNRFELKPHKKFPKHKRIYVRVKDNPRNPYNSTIFEKIISMKDEHPDYVIYIHDDYLTYESLTIKNFEAVRLPIDDKLWNELYFVFDVVKIKKEKAKRVANKWN